VIIAGLGTVTRLFSLPGVGVVVVSDSVSGASGVASDISGCNAGCAVEGVAGWVVEVVVDLEVAVATSVVTDGRILAAIEELLSGIGVDDEVVNL